MKNHFDKGTILIIFLTIALFIMALFFKGLTKDILLEIGVLLVSIKLIIMMFNINKYNDKILKELKDIKNLYKKRPASKKPETDLK